MPRKATSPRVAKIASQKLRAKNTGPKTKAIAGSALGQREKSGKK